MDTISLKEWMEEHKEAIDIGLPLKFNDIFDQASMCAENYEKAMEQLDDVTCMGIGEKRYITYDICEDGIEIVFMEDTIDYSLERLRKVYNVLSQANFRRE